VYLLNTYDMPSRPLYNLTALTLNESAPGHAFRCPRQEHKSQPEFRHSTPTSQLRGGGRCIASSLGLEMNMYETPYRPVRNAGLPDLASARLVVDTGCTHKDASRERAIAYLHDYTALPPARNRDPRWSRYIAWARAGAVVLPRRAGDPAGDGTGRRVRFGAKFNVARSTTWCWSLDQCPCRCCRAGGSVYSRVGRGRTPIWSKGWCSAAATRHCT